MLTDLDGWDVGHFRLGGDGEGGSQAPNQPTCLSKFEVRREENEDGNEKLVGICMIQKEKFEKISISRRSRR